MALGKTLPTDNLRECEKIIIAWCFMRKSNEEKTVYVFLHYAVAQELWSLVFACLVSPR